MPEHHPRIIDVSSGHQPRPPADRPARIGVRAIASATRRQVGLLVRRETKAGRRGALTGVAVSLLIAVVYWATASLFENMGNVSQLPPALAAWSPDVIFSLAGGYMVLKTPS